MVLLRTVTLQNLVGPFHITQWKTVLENRISVQHNVTVYRVHCWLYWRCSRWVFNLGVWRRTLNLITNIIFLGGSRYYFDIYFDEQLSFTPRRRPIYSFWGKWIINIPPLLLILWYTISCKLEKFMLQKRRRNNLTDNVIVLTEMAQHSCFSI